jgi:pantothenate kinase
LLTVFNRWWGIDMATASIEVSGPKAERLAGELQAALAAAIQPGESVSPVEVERSAELVIAIIGLVFSGVGTARTIWEWWHDRRPEGVKVKILLDDGTQIDLSGVDQKQLEIVLDRRTTSGH